MARPDRGARQAPAYPPEGKTLARFDTPTGDGTTFLVVADTHLSPTAHGTLKCYHRTKQRLQMAVADAHRLNVDGVVVAGDLTKDGTTDEFALAEELLDVAPRPTLVVPGNHDLRAGESERVTTGAAFAAWRGESAYPATREIGSVAVTGLDSTLPPTVDPVGGAVAADARETVRSQSPRGPQIAVMHHPLAAIPGQFDAALPTDAYQVDCPEHVARSLVEAGVDLLVTGHLHWPYAAEYGDINVVGAPSTASFPPAYLLVHVDPQGTTVSLVPLAGEAGLSEAYEFAREDEHRGEAIRNAVRSDYFSDLPLVDQQTQASPQPGATRSEGTRSD